MFVALATFTVLDVLPPLLWIWPAWWSWWPAVWPVSATDALPGVKRRLDQLSLGWAVSPLASAQSWRWSSEEQMGPASSGDRARAVSWTGRRVVDSTELAGSDGERDQDRSSLHGGSESSESLTSPFMDRRLFNACWAPWKTGKSETKNPVLTQKQKKCTRERQHTASLQNQIPVSFRSSYFS